MSSIADPQRLVELVAHRIAHEAANHGRPRLPQRARPRRRRRAAPEASPPRRLADPAAAVR